MEYKGLKKDLFSQIFYINLEKAILDSKSIKNVEYTDKQLKGYINKLIDVFEKVELEDGKYHIYSSQLTNLKRNPLDEIFNIFVKNENSTYHRNDSKNGNNGYTHWYDIKDWFLELYEHSLKDTYDYIKFNKKYEKSLKECKKTIKQIKQNNSKKKKKDIFKNVDQYLEIRKDIFLVFFEVFEKRKFDIFPKYLENMFYYNENYVYVDNNLNNGKIDKFKGLGRKYTLLTSTKKIVRKHIFKGFTEIDINSCSSSILCNLYLNDINKKNSKNDLSELKDIYENLFQLITDKKKFREKYQKILNTDEDTVKNIITHLLFEPNSTKIYEKFSKDKVEELKNYVLKSTIGKGFNKKTIEHTVNIISNPKKSILFNSFVNELIMMRNDVKNLYYGSDLYTSLKDYKFIEKPFINHLDIREIKDIVDKWFVLDGSEDNKSDSKIIHKIIEVVENQIRELVFEFLTNKGLTNVYQIHDAFIFNEVINLEELENFIFEEIGFIFKFSQERY